MPYSKETLTFMAKRIIGNLPTLVVLGFLFFSIAGTVRVWGFWIYAATVLLYQLLSLLYILPRYPAYIELAQVRAVKRTGAKWWDKPLVFSLMGAVLLTYTLAAMDVGRLHLAELPLTLAPFGVIFYAAGTALNQWAMLHNPHFERELRLQTDRDHRVITTGPYRYIRHPGYLGSILGFLCFPLILGSGLAFLGSTLSILGMLVRTYLEDKALRKELPGYADYAKSVRHRLLPYIW
jgi:protein-S-isoprenylcysteine O-methyltransferase Ste14